MNIQVLRKREENTRALNLMPAEPQSGAVRIGGKAETGVLKDTYQGTAPA